MLVVGIVGVASFLAFGQTEDVLRDVQAVVVGDVLGGTSSETGTTVSVTAQLRVKRVIAGPLAAGMEIGLAWTYEIRGMWPRADTASVRQVSGLWMLKGVGGGRWQPVPVKISVPGAMGGVFLGAPAESVPAEFYYLPDAEIPAKVAMEAGAALSAIARRAGEKLNPEVVVEGPGRSGYRVIPAQAEFMEWMWWLSRLEPEATLPVYQRLAASPVANLRAVGLGGLLKQGDAAALTALERDLPAIAPTLAGMNLGSGLNLFALIKDGSALHALGRMALAEPVLPSMELQAHRPVGPSAKAGALTGLVAMLDHPNRDMRTSVVMSICSLLDARRNAEMRQHCPDRSPLRDPSQEPALMQYWKAWWADQPASKGGMVRPPDRYRALAGAQKPERVITMEERFRMLAMMYSGSEKRRKEDPKQPAWPLLPEAKLSPEDAEVARRVFMEVGRAQDETVAAYAALKQSLRMQGKPWDGAAFEKIAVVESEAVRRLLDQLRRELSSEGWAAAEKSMKEMDIR